MAGWISLHRKIMDNPIYSNANMLKLWIHCLMKATHTERDQLIGNQMVKLEVGQFVTGRHALAEEFNKGAKKDEIISPSTLWRWLNNFEQWQMLNIKKTTKYSVVTIVQWSEYQHNGQQVNNKWTADEQQMNSKRTTDEQQVNTNNNVNNANNSNKDSTTISTDGFGTVAQMFEANICMLSPMQTESLGMWFDDFNENQEIITEAIRTAADRNKKSYGFVEYLLKEWANNKLTTLDQVKSHERNKFGGKVHKFEPQTKRKTDGYDYDYGF
ncbi:hypothetical protein CSV72_02055 [Sporosarcina sp. P20a]|uniref:DnaD domain-containing protein n=1 Tax=Sporosarcina sp. P20a TaxID=2048256 RepID=UPI000C162851|nr:DnaD domain protein [Sporosarcina sp. P20a]PIC87955.1 hypothetical protein CSV72_02055 [Sporosarcina sp. P20a]